MIFKEQFYPTPGHIAKKLLEGFRTEELQRVLEPSAGKGDLAEAVKDIYDKSQIDVIEIDENLQHILLNKEYRLVGNDFLAYTSEYSYQTVVMNPPFKDGEKHLLKAIELMERGGKIACILNAETIKNPYSNDRKYLVRRLQELNAKIEFIENAFSSAEVPTGVEIALINIEIEQYKPSSDILKGMKTRYLLDKEEEEKNYIITADYIQSMLDNYNIEIKAGIKLIDEYKAFNRVTLEDKFEETFILTVGNGNRFQDLENEFIKRTRAKYWKKIFNSNAFYKFLTNNESYILQEKVEEMRNYEFSEFNILQLRINLQQGLMDNIENAIMDLFEECSHKHYWNESSKNIHYYNGWKTNKAWKINKKIILPLNGYQSVFDDFNIKYGATRDKLGDISKVCSYLDGKTFNTNDFMQTADIATKEKIVKNLEFEHITCNFYKKGTTHIVFNDEEVLKRFNRYGSKKKGWLPPSYGRKEYKDMTKEEKDVIDEFEGKEEYTQAYKNGTLEFDFMDMAMIEESDINLLSNDIPMLEMAQ